MDKQEIKQALGIKASYLIQNNMIVGLGTGSTADEFIKALIQRKKEGKNFQVVASSEKSAKLASVGGLNVLDINDVPKIDITVDGADEITKNNQIIKGAGGAFFREKILATSSNELVIIADDSKLVERLGSKKLPVEISFFGAFATKSKIDNLGFSSKIREFENSFFLTDSGNLVIDIELNESISNFKKLENELLNIPGVIETGLFLNIAKKAYISNDFKEIKEFFFM